MRDKRILLIALIAILSIVVLSLIFRYQMIESIPFETVAKGESLGPLYPYQPVYTVITNKTGLDNFLSKFEKAKEIINFSEDEFKDYVLIVAYRVAGGGCEIEIKKIIRKKNVVEVIIQYKIPKFGLDVETHPYHIVKVKRDYFRSAGKLTFVFKDTSGKELNREVLTI